MIFRCAQCDSVHDGAGFKTACPACSGLIDVEYDLASATLHDSPNPYHRFFDLLPVSDRDLLATNSRYTPCVRAESLGSAIGLPWLYLKDETVQPTGTTKDRMATVALAHLWESGVRAFCAASTGNSSTAYAHGIRRIPGLRMFVFTPEEAMSHVDLGDSPRVISIGLRDATYAAAYRAAAEFANKQGLVPECGFFNPGAREGLKLAFFEAVEQIPRPIDWYAQAVSSGMGVVGTLKGAAELQAMGEIRRVPRALCVQQDSCAPLVNADREKSESLEAHHMVARPTGIAAQLLNGDPSHSYPHLRNAVRKSKGGFASVTEADIRKARQMANECEGIDPCNSAATALAGVIKQARRGLLDPNATVLVNITGSERAAGHAGQRSHWMVQSNDGWQLEDPDVTVPWRGEERLNPVVDGS
ncbi:MAG: pyridoxal-phosphate dependent enzyme [Planctomycetota bacterium]